MRTKKQKTVVDLIKWLGLDFNIIYENDTKWWYKLAYSEVKGYLFKIKDKYDEYADFNNTKEIMSMTLNQLVKLKPIEKDK